MFEVCLMGEKVVESEVVVEYRLTKFLNKMITKGCKRFYIGGDSSFGKIALKVASKARTNDKSLRYFCTIYSSFEKRPLYKFRTMIDRCEVVLCYYNPANNDSSENLFFNYARIQKKRIINLFEGEHHFWFGEPLEELEVKPKKLIELLRD